MSFLNLDKMKYTAIVIALLLIFVTLVVSSMTQQSGTCDEIAHHIPTGYVLLSKADYRMDTSHPPLARYIVALPLKLFMRLELPSDKAKWRVEDRSEFGRDFFFKYNRNPREILFFSRLAVSAVGVLCGLILFVWAKQLYGVNAALFSLFLYAFSPNILAHSGLATTDMVATCFMLLSLYSFWLFLKDFSAKNIIFAGISLGLAQLSKYSLILLYPLFLLIFFLEKPRERGGLLKLAAIIGISLIILWLGYGFDFNPLLKDAMRPQEKAVMIQHLLHKNLDYFLFNVSFPLSAHLLGILGIIRHGYEGHGTYFLGRHYGHGNYLYFLIAFLIKTPIPTLVFIFAGLWLCIKNKIKSNERFLLVTAALFFIAASLSKLQLGLRYILPVYPLLFIIAGRSAEFLSRKHIRVAAIVLVFWLAVSSLRSWPEYLSYFNESIGGADNGWKYLRDSNIDWGQDLPALARYMAKENISEISLEYFGQDSPEVYGINFKKFQEDEYSQPQEKVYAISVQYLEHASWAKGRNPSAKAGKSIFIYDLRGKIQ